MQPPAVEHVQYYDEQYYCQTIEDLEQREVLPPSYTTQTNNRTNSSGLGSWYDEYRYR